MTNYTWKPADGTYVQNIVSMAETHFQNEIDMFFNPEPITYSRNISHAIVNQFYLPSTELVYVAIDENNNLLAYTWACSNERAYWSDNNIVYIKMAHVDLNLSSKLRVKLVIDMFTIWENFAKFAQVPIICSTTMRKDQAAFLKLHERHGFEVRGSYCYKKINLN
jgi:hypothetical protein